MSTVPDGLSNGCKGAAPAPGAKLPLVGDESLMAPKAHGTSAAPVKAALRWGVDPKLADNICSFNRHYAERSGYWLTTRFLAEADKAGETTFYDSVTGRPLFIAPRGRSWAEFEKESRSHGWPSFRDAEVVWDDVRVLPDGEAVSVFGTHLGHNLPDAKGNRYCINLVSVAAEGGAQTGGASSRDQSVAGAASEPAAPTVVKTDAEWRAALPPAVYAVARRNGTETPWSSPLNDAKGGNFHCACCGALLYEGSTKFNSGTGWPSFYAAADGGKAVRYVVDSAYGMTRTEMRCRACDAHLGHVFNDGPAPTRMRHCVNGVCLTYKADTK